MKNKNSNLNDWKDIKDKQFGKVGTKRRDQLDREVRALKIGLMLRQARESKNMTQEDLARVIEKDIYFKSRK